MNGILIKLLVAPTSCIVLITNRLEYIDRRIELLINKTATRIKRQQVENHSKFYFLIFSSNKSKRGWS